MTKPGAHPPPTLRSSGTRSYWVKSPLAPADDTGSPNSADDPSATRFVEPLRLDDRQRASLLQVLRKLRVGDAYGRELFLAAIEYDLANYQQQAGSEPPAPEPAHQPTPNPDQEALTPLAAAIRSVCEKIDALDEPARASLLQDLHQGDRFQRTYDARYLSELRCELEMLGQACTSAPTSDAAPAPARLSASGRQLISRIADAYTDCFEIKPATEPDGPFAQILAHLLQITAIDLPTDEAALKQSLNAGSG